MTGGVASPHLLPLGRAWPRWRPARPVRRVVTTVLFTDIVDSTASVARLGDRAWRDLLTAHDRATRSAVRRHRGRLVKTTGDGVLATFGAPGQAIEAARAIRDAVAALGLEIRAGLHTGECDHRDGDVHGIALHIGARVAATARPGEIRVSRTVADILTGSPVPLEDRGEHLLRGVPGRWRLYAIAS
jgi:class 3 adenylate cyclase